MARQQAEPRRGEALLQEAAELLQQAQAQEDLLLATQQQLQQQRDEAGSRRAVPPAPLVLERTPSSITLTCPPLQLRGGRVPVTYAVYCKSYGAGVALSINSTSMEYPGGCSGRWREPAEPPGGTAPGAGAVPLHLEERSGPGALVWLFRPVSC